jgi:hypothetical protein
MKCGWPFSKTLRKISVLIEAKPACSMSATGHSRPRKEICARLRERWGTHRHDHINAKPHKLFGSVSQRARSISKVSMFNGDILAIADDGNLIGSSHNPNDAYEGYVPLRSLGAAGGWPLGRSSSKPRNEIAPPHANTKDCRSLPG